MNHVKIDIAPPTLNDRCKYCCGSGIQRAMQTAATIDAGSIRVQDKMIKCIHCNGTGYKFN